LTLSRDERIEEYNQIFIQSPGIWSGGIERDLFVTNYFLQPLSILDIGCGNGHTLQRLHQIWPGTIMRGLDWSPAAIGAAKFRFPDGRFLCGEIDDVMLPADLVLCMGVAEHFVDLSELSKIRRLMKGQLYLEIPHNLLGSPDKSEGFRRYGRQEEWHLERETWEKIIKQDFDIVKSVVGLEPAWEFIWILE
jgi:SAM-dependent methyltransferase